MMDGRHFENSFLAQLVGADLQDHRQRFDYEDSSDEGKEEFLLDHDGDGADGAAEGERAYIAHEDFGGMRVIPKKSDGGADHGSAENGKFADLRHALQFQVSCECGVTTEVSEDGKRSGGDHGAADG